MSRFGFYDVFVGIDPGLTGAIAMLAVGQTVTTQHGSYNLKPMIYVTQLPTQPFTDTKRCLNIKAIASLLRYPDKVFVTDHTVINREYKIALEKVGAMPSQGVTSMFTFGQVFGELLGMIKTLDLNYELPIPQKWKKLILVDTDKSKEAAIKHVSLYYPHISLLPTPRCKIKSHGMAEAICLAEYAWRTSLASIKLPVT